MNRIKNQIRKRVTKRGSPKLQFKPYWQLGKVENLFSISNPLLEDNQISLVPNILDYRNPNTFLDLILFNIKMKQMKILEVVRDILVLDRRNAYPS